MPFVRWIGQKEPLQTNPAKVRELVKAGKVTEREVWEFHKNLTRAIPGRTARLLAPSEGLSKSYLWGPDPGSFVQLVTDADWRRIQQLAEAKQFVLVDGLEPERT